MKELFLGLDFNYKPNSLIDNFLNDVVEAISKESEYSIKCSINEYNYSIDDNKCLREKIFSIYPNNYSLKPFHLFTIKYIENDIILNIDLIIKEYYKQDRKQIIDNYNEIKNETEVGLIENLLNIIKKNMHENLYFDDSLKACYRSSK